MEIVFKRFGGDDTTTFRLLLGVKYKAVSKRIPRGEARSRFSSVVGGLDFRRRNFTEILREVSSLESLQSCQVRSREFRDKELHLEQVNLLCWFSPSFGRWLCSDKGMERAGKRRTNHLYDHACSAPDLLDHASFCSTRHSLLVLIPLCIEHVARMTGGPIDSSRLLYVTDLLLVFSTLPSSVCWMLLPPSPPSLSLLSSPASNLESC